MTVVRRFLVAPALVRLIRKERGAVRITEGYFPPQAGRTSFVRVEGSQCHLVLVTGEPGSPATEERTEVPRAHGDALLDVCAGKAAYDRIALGLQNGREAQIDRYVAPGAVDVVSVTFAEANESGDFAVPPWFGPEVTEDAAYEGRSLALQGVPAPVTIEIGNPGLDAVLDLLEPRYGLGRYSAPAPRADDPGKAGAMRRLAVNPAPAQPAAPVPSSPEAPAAPEAEEGDARIDDVIESLSKALGQSVPADAARDDNAAAFERWTVRPRRTQPT
ncbi:MAG: hypothetical protein PGN34_05295 [Methylobacterium frigidaeris]